MHKNTIIVAGVALAALFSSAAYADPLISLGGLEIGSASTVGNPVGLPEVTNVVTEAIGGMTGGSVGVPGVAEVTTSGSNPINNSVTLLGGGGQTIDGGVGGLLGQPGTNLAINLPSTDSLGVPGLPGLPGLPVEIPVIPGVTGPSGGNGVAGPAGPSGSNGTASTTTYNLNLMLQQAGAGSNGNGSSYTSGTQFSAAQGSSRLRMLLKILEDRDWLRLVAGNAVCLPAFGTASVNGWLKPQEMAQLKQVVSYYKRDIVTLQKMLTNCRSGAHISRNDAKRVIGIDIKNGKPVLFML